MRRRLFRACIAFSAAWSLFFFYMALQLNQEWVAGRSDFLCSPRFFYCWFWLWERRLEVMLLPWVLIAAAMCIRWVISTRD
jgi:hypothetical protein